MNQRTKADFPEPGEPEMTHVTTTAIRYLGQLSPQGVTLRMAANKGGGRGVEHTEPTVEKNITISLKLIGSPIVWRWI